MGTDSRVAPAPAGEDVSAELRLADATELAHGLCARIGRTESIRVLSIKGPIANLHAIRRNHFPADTDVLVEPAGVEAFCTALEGHGWRRWVGRQTPSLLPNHAWTYTHPGWPGAIDVHTRYPGFFADPADVFDALWADRIVASIAHTQVIGTSRAASAVIGALHAARHPNSTRHREEMDQIIDLLIHGFSEPERRAFYDLALAGRSLTVLRSPITRSSLGPTADDLDQEEHRRWQLMIGLDEGSSALGWVMAVRGTAWWRLPALATAALWVRRRDVPRTDPDILPTRSETWAYRRSRWARGARLFARFLRLRRGA